MLFFFFSSRRRHTRYWRDWSSDVCSSDLRAVAAALGHRAPALVADDARAALALAERARAAGLGTVVVLTRDPADLVRELRSEERRVGKECRWRGPPDH